MFFKINRKNEYYLLNNINFPLSEEDQKLTNERFPVGTLIDGELVLSVPKSGSGPKELTYLVFDCIAFHRKLLAKRTFDKRLAYFRGKLYQPYIEALKRRAPNLPPPPFDIKFKNMEFSYGIPVIFQNMKKLRHISDGLIFTSREAPYVFKTDEMILKWKPPSQNTVDFLLSLEFPLVNQDGEEFLDYDAKPICHLKIWMGNERYQLVETMYLTDDEWEQLKSLNEPLDDRIVECYQDEKHRWRYMRFRDDKDNGNHFTIFSKVINSIEDCVTKEELFSACDSIKKHWKIRQKLADDRMRAEHERHRAEKAKWQREQERRHAQLHHSNDAVDPEKRKGEFMDSEQDPKKPKVWSVTGNITWPLVLSVTTKKNWKYKKHQKKKRAMY